MQLSPIFLCLLATVQHVAAHGWLNQIAIDGTIYAGNVPNSAPFDSPIRLIDDVDPVKGASNPALNCGQNAQKAALVVDANPGSEMTFAWVNGQGGNWPHNIGPMMTYMASCGNTTCDQFDAANAEWFKIDQVGREADGQSWVQQETMNGGNFTVNLPTDITPGQYLVRHEIIALHLATTEGGAEFYPSCTQINMTGTGTGIPNSTVAFPGGYSDTEPGILDPSIFDTTAPYTFPGPLLSNVISDATTTASDNSTDAAAPTPTSMSCYGRRDGHSMRRVMRRHY